MRAYRKIFMLALATIATTVLYAGIASAAGLIVKEKEGVGKFLADENGMTLYLFKKDQPGKSACLAAGGCLEKWPIYYTEPLKAAEGIDAANLGVITRDDGKKQVTYKGLPLYYFFKDKAAGDTLGQGVNNVWYVVAP